MEIKFRRYWWIYLLAVLFIYMGIRYNPAYMASIFTSVGLLPKKLLILLIVLEVVSVGIGAAIFLLRKTIYRYRKEIALSILTFVIIFSIFEIGIRAYLYNVDPEKQKLYLDKDSIRLDQRYSKHPYLIFIPTPNYKSLDGKNKHNSLGYRGEEIASPKPDDTYRIVALGGSTTYGSKVKSYQEAYPYLLEKVLKEKYDYLNVDVINAGVGGYTSWESLINFEFRVLDLNPDLIIVYHNTNDIHARLVNPEYYRGDNSGSRKSWTELREPFLLKSVFIRFALTKITGYSLEPALGKYIQAKTAVLGLTDVSYNEILGDTPLNVLKKNKPVYFERNYRNIVAIARQNKIDVLFTTWAYSDQFEDYAATPHYQYGFKENNEIIKKIGKDEKVAVLDFAEEMPEDKKYWADGRHLNYEGNLFKAEIFADFIHKNNIIKK